MSIHETDAARVLYWMKEHDKQAALVEEYRQEAMELRESSAQSWAGALAWQRRAEKAEKRIAELEAQLHDNRLIADGAYDRAEKAEKRVTELEALVAELRVYARV